MRRGIKFWIKILTLPILTVVFFILLYNGFILERIRHRINSQYELKIDRLEGNLFTHLKLSGVKFGKVFNAPCVSISYTPLSIMRRQIKRVEIEFPAFEIGIGKGRYAIVSPLSVGSFVLKGGKILNIGRAEDVDSLELTGSLIEKNGVKVLEIAHGKANFNPAHKIMCGAIKIDKIKGALSLNKNSIRIETLSADVHGGEVKVSGVMSIDSLFLKLYTSHFPIHGIVKNVTGMLNADINIRKKQGPTRPDMERVGKAENRNYLSVDGWVELKNGEYKGQSIGELTTHITLVNNDPSGLSPQGRSLKLKIKEWKISKMSFNGNAQIDLTALPLLTYRATLNAKQIDLATILGKLPTDLSGKIEIEGKGSKFRSVVDLSGRARDLILSSVQAEIRYRPSEVEIISFKGVHKEGEVFATGNITGEDLDISLSGKDIALGLFLSQFSGISNFDLVLRGTIRVPSVSGTFYIKDFESGEIRSEYLSGNLNLTKVFPPDGEGEVEVANLVLYKNKFETFKAAIATTGEHSSYEIKAHSESTDLNCKGENYGENLIIHTLSFTSPTLRVLNEDDIKFYFNQNKININSCKLLVNDSLVQVGGWASKDNLVLTVVGKNLVLHSFSDAIEGTAYFTCNVSGTFKSPVISVASEVTDFSYSGIKADKIFIALLYRDQLLHIERSELSKGIGVAKISGELPVKLPFEILDNPMDLEVTFSNFGEDIFLPYHKFVELNEGRLNGNFKIKGSGKHPIVYGNLKFNGESINAKFLGTTLKSPRAELNFEGNKVAISTFDAKTSSGFLKVTGNARLPDKLDFGISAKDLPIRSMEDVDAKLSMDLTLEGSTKSPIVRGDIKVEEAIITMPFRKRTTINLRNPVTYNLTVDFPDKVWIRNEMVDAELEGKIKVRKDRDGFFLAGDTKVKEGYFYYFERPFKIDKGEFKFTNSPELNPEIDLSTSTVVSYTAPDTMANKDITFIDTINLIVRGKLMEPEFILSSQPPMPLEDILSLLSLNMKLDDFLKLQKFDYPQTVGAKVISYYVLRRLGFLEELKSQIGVDALRLETELLGEEKRARFNVGKYVRDDLYVSYTNDLFSLSKHNFKAEYSPWKYGALVGETEEGKLKAGVQFKIRY